MAKKAAVQQGNVISFDPDTFTSGGLFDDEDAIVKTSMFTEYDFNGKSDPRTCLYLALETRNGDEVEQYWSVGDPDTFWPNETGKGLISTKQALNNSSNYAILLANMFAQGFPKEKLALGDAGLFEGLDAHWMRVPPPKKRGNRTPGQDGKVREDLVLVPSQIHSLPWDKPAKGKGKTAGKTSTSAATVSQSADNGNGAAGDDDADEMISVMAVIQALAANGGPIARNKLASLCMPYLPEDMPVVDKNKRLIMGKIFNADWLAAHPAEWSYDNGIVTAAG